MDAAKRLKWKRNLSIQSALAQRMPRLAEAGVERLAFSLMDSRINALVVSAAGLVKTGTTTDWVPDPPGWQWNPKRMNGSMGPATAAARAGRAPGNQARIQGAG